VIDRHPWAFRAMAQRPRQRINTMRHIEQSMAAVAPLDLDEATAGAILVAVDDYTLGHAVRKHVRQRVVRAMRAAGARGGRKEPERDPQVEAALEAGELPLLARALAARGPRTRGARPRAGLPPEADFERGLDWLLDGIEAAVAGRGRPAAS
jgi:hypothetical protein